MIRRSRRSPRWFGALAAVSLLSLSVRAGAAEPESDKALEPAPESDAVEVVEPEPETPWELEREAEAQVETDVEKRDRAALEAASSGPGIGSKIFDCAVLRPFGFAATALGGVFFVPAAVLVSPSGADGLRSAWNFFVVSQAKATFVRPLGDF